MKQIDEINQVRELICKGNINKSVDMISLLLKKITDTELKNRMILLCSNLRNEHKKESIGIKENDIKRDSLIFSILEHLDLLDEHFLNAQKDSSLLTKEDLSLGKGEINNLYDKLLIESDKIAILGDKDIEKLYMQKIKLKKIMYGAIDKKFLKSYPYIIFNRLFFAEELDDIEIKELSNLPQNNDFKWYEKSIIVSGLSLSIIRKFDIKKIELLINFLVEFEDKVWQKALLGLVLGLINRDHKIDLFPNVKRRLERLQEISDIGKGLATIDIELRQKGYQKCYLYAYHKYLNQSRGFEALSKIEQWFLPYYENNPVVNQIKDHLPNVKNVGVLPNLLLKDKHLSNAQKYAISLDIKNWEQERVSELINWLGNDCGQEHIYDRYLSDFYWFFNNFPNSEFEDIFKEKIDIYNSNLIDLLLKTEQKEIYQAVIEFKCGNKLRAIKLLKGLSFKGDIQLLDEFDTGYLQYSLNDYDKSIEIFNKLIAKNSENAIFYTNVGYLKFILGLFDESKKFIQRAIELGDDFYSNKNLGYHSIKEKKIDDAINHFRLACNSRSKISLISEIEADKEHIKKQININFLFEILNKI